MFRWLGLGDVRGWCGIFRPAFLTRKKNVNGVLGSTIGTIEEHVEVQGLAMHEPSRLQRCLCSPKVGPTNQNIDILGVANGCLVDSTDPLGDGIAADDRVSDSGLSKRCSDPPQSSFDLFHRKDRP